MKNITDADYKNAIFLGRLEIKNLGQFHYLYLRRKMLFLAAVYECFRNKCIKIFEFHPAHFFQHQDCRGKHT